MSAIETVRAALLASSLLVAQVGTRIRPDAASDRDVAPYLVIRRKKVERDFSLDNTLLAMREIFEIECWADERLTTTDLEELVVDALLAADLVPDDNDPDAMDPVVDVRCAVVLVSVWTTPEIA